MAAAPRLTVRVPGSTAGIRRAMDAFEAFIARHAIVVPAPWRVQVALDEVLSNIVQHGGAATGAAIRIAFAVVAGELRVTIADAGPPYDPLAAPPPDTSSPLEQRQPGGLGVHLVRELMDRVEYRRTSGENRLVLGQRLSTP
jgi:anti-sigma regulatory factor (Ser/Thr protein kinase)